MIRVGRVGLVPLDGRMGRMKVAGREVIRPSDLSDHPTMYGAGGIRTHERVSPLAVFKTAAFNHSATTPGKNGESRVKNSEGSKPYGFS